MFLIWWCLNVLNTSSLFGQMSNLVASQIMNYADVSSRANSIEKWVAVADICRCMHNYNGVLEITSALNRSAIYRLKKTWAKVSKQVRKIWLQWRFLDFTSHYVVHETMNRNRILSKTFSSSTIVLTTCWKHQVVLVCHVMVFCIWCIAFWVSLVKYLWEQTDLSRISRCLNLRL